MNNEGVDIKQQKENTCVKGKKQYSICVLTNNKQFCTCVSLLPSSHLFVWTLKSEKLPLVEADDKTSDDAAKIRYSFALHLRAWLRLSHRFDTHRISFLSSFFFLEKLHNARNKRKWKFIWQWDAKKRGVWKKICLFCDWVSYFVCHNVKAIYIYISHRIHGL